MQDPWKRKAFFFFEKEDSFPGCDLIFLVSTWTEAYICCFETTWAGSFLMDLVPSFALISSQRHVTLSDKVV